ncbi:hypothetical protein [Peribacillus loiseleuriae]|uniref:hypothetical protein n=1 Tax=Peribacillus loiseleuriae TaxID=1679170 RepID=UPI003CFDBF15
MLVEVGSTIIMAGVAGYSYLKTSGSSMSDADKIQRIFNNAGMNARENGKVKTIRIHRKTKIEGGIEYVFQLPLGMSAKQIIDHKNVLEDGLNARHKVLEFDPTELLSLKWDRNANRVLNDMAEYLGTFRHEGNIVYYLNKNGRERIQHDVIRKKTPNIQHFLVRNQLWMHLKRLHSWQNEAKIKVGLPLFAMLYSTRRASRCL